MSTAALACGLVAVGCCDGSVTPLLTTTLLEKTDAELKDPYSRFMALGLGLTLLGLFPTELNDSLYCVCCVSGLYHPVLSRPLARNSCSTYYHVCV